MATIDIGKIKPVFKGTYDNSTAYVLDDIVYYNGSSYVAKTSTTGNLPTDTTKWNILASGSGGIWDSTLALGSAGQSVKVNSGGTALEFGTISAGTYSVHAVSKYNYQTNVTQTNTAHYHDIAGGNYVQFQPTSTNDLIYISHCCATYNTAHDTGCDVYMMMKEGSTSIGSGDTKLNYDGSHAQYISGSSVSLYSQIAKSFILPCTGLNTSSVYYLEQAGATYNNNQVQFNHLSGGGSGSYRTHNVTLIHYKA